MSTNNPIITTPNFTVAAHSTQSYLVNSPYLNGGTAAANLRRASHLFDRSVNMSQNDKQL